MTSEGSLSFMLFVLFLIRSLRLMKTRFLRSATVRNKFQTETIPGDLHTPFYASSSPGSYAFHSSSLCQFAIFSLGVEVTSRGSHCHFDYLPLYSLRDTGKAITSTTLTTRATTKRTQQKPATKSETIQRGQESNTES